MIRTLGELLHKFIEHEQQILQGYSFIEHPGMIGDMYEGLTQEFARRALPPGSDLRVVTGKIINSKSELSKQIDCMLVEGEGHKIPHTDHYIYPTQQIVMIIEVKKKLNKENLISALELHRNYWSHIYEPKAMPANLLCDAWRSIHGTELPTRSELRQLSLESQSLYHALLIEANMPVRVIFGFDGYKTEKGLRDGLLDIIEEMMKKEKAPFSPVSLPSLIVSGDISITKFNGMPFVAPYDHTAHSWTFYGSRPVRAIEQFLEFLWTRISYYHNCPSDLFGDDLTMAIGHGFISARPAFEAQRQIGWHFDIIPLITEASLPVECNWSPHVLSLAEFVVLNELLKGNVVNPSDTNLTKFLTEQGVTIDEVAKLLQAKRLAYLGGQQFRLLTKECMCAIDSELGYCAGENVSGRFTRWIERRRVKST